MLHQSSLLWDGYHFKTAVFLLWNESTLWLHCTLRQLHLPKKTKKKTTRQQTVKSKSVQQERGRRIVERKNPHPADIDNTGTYCGYQ